MDGVRVIRPDKSAGGVVVWVEVLRRKNDRPGNRLKLPVLFKPEGDKGFCVQRGAGDRRERAVFVGDEGEILFFHRRDGYVTRFSAEALAGVDVFAVLKPVKRAVFKQRVKGAYRFDVGVEIEPAVPVYHSKANEVAEKRPFAVFQAVFRVRICRNVEIALVPFGDFISGTVLFPACNTFLGKPRLFRTAEPAVVDVWGDHVISFLL